MLQPGDLQLVIFGCEKWALLLHSWVFDVPLRGRTPSRYYVSGCLVRETNVSESGVRCVSVWRGLLGLGDVVVEDVELDGECGALIARVRPRKNAPVRCSRCLARCPRYDHGGGRRRWRHLDAGMLRVWIEAEAPRVACRGCGIVVAHVPWARAGAGHTVDFDRQVAWHATHMAKTAVVELTGIAWRTVGTIVERYWRDVEDYFDRYDGLRRIGIDEISYKKGTRYLTIVVDHDTGRLVWAGTGRDTATLEEFFDLLGPARCAQVTLVSADIARYIAAAVKRHLPNAVVCTDPFHVVAWATNALDLERRAAWNRAPGRAHDTAVTRQLATGHARTLKGARWALWKNPENLTEKQRATLVWIATTDPHLHQAYLLKEGLRYVFKLKGTDAITALDAWITWARTSTSTAFRKTARTIEANRATIDAALTHRLSNALTESMNTKIRRIIRTAYGFHTPDALIALALLTHGGYRPTLPTRT
jgi:transposase